MTPSPDFSEPRRSFVKKTLATSVSISFAGLIRAHGEEGSGTTYTTVGTYATTAQTTAMGTYDTTYGDTGWGTVTTASTYQTTFGTVQATTAVTTTAPTSKCEWLDRVEIRLTLGNKLQSPFLGPQPGVMAEDPQKDDFSERVALGTLDLVYLDCAKNERRKSYAVASGGYISHDRAKTDLADGSNTSIPPGNSSIKLKHDWMASVGKNGHFITNMTFAGVLRTELFVHHQARPQLGSSGCIVLKTVGDYNDLHDRLLAEWKMTGCPHSRPACDPKNPRNGRREVIPIEIVYIGANPIYKKK